MYVTFRVFAIRDRDPDPFHASVPGHVAVTFCTFALFKQCDDMRAADLTQGWEVFISWAVV